MSTATAAAASRVSRSVYVAQLRRAFLMRAHPDRFRNCDDDIRRRQATLLQALSERWNASDFQEYTSNRPPSISSPLNSQRSDETTLSYVLQKRDGSLLEQNIQLNDSVENLLSHLSRALRLSGAASLPPPPAAATQKESNGLHASLGDNRMDPSGTEDLWSTWTHQSRARDILTFLKALTREALEERKAARMDASAAALVARRLYSFQAIDGIRMGWSSDSFAVLLRSLIKLHDEHSHRLSVSSFYPLRLVFSHDDFRDTLDIFGGVIYLHPAATQLELLESLQSVTQDHLEEFQRNRIALQERASLLQNTLGIKLSKGHSTSSEEYHVFLDHLTLGLNHAKSEVSESRALEVERVRVVVESFSAFRRSRVSKEGYIQTHTNLTLEELAKVVGKLAPDARKVKMEVERQDDLCKQAIRDIQYSLGVTKVSRRGVVSHKEFLDCLVRLQQQHERLRDYLSGHSLGIASQGQFCHLADDGSLIIPHDWL